MRALSTCELVVRAQAGEARAADELLARYRPRVYALALHLTANSADADDVTQETMLRAHRAIGQFQGGGAYFTWLYRITVRRALSLQRQRGARREEDPRLLAALAVDTDGSPFMVLARRREYTALLSALDSLPSGLRTTVVLVALAGLPHADAGRVLGISGNAVAWRMYKARQLIRAQLTQPDAKPCWMWPPLTALG